VVLAVVALALGQVVCLEMAAQILEAVAGDIELWFLEVDWGVLEWSSLASQPQIIPAPQPAPQP
jgi:hypothetical protein